MSRLPSTRVTPLLAALVLAGCGLDFSTPRAYRCSTDEECRGGWRCLGDSYCHDPAVGVATPCDADGDCAGGWRCLGDETCHDPAVGASTPCLASAQCTGAWRCADGLCRDPLVGITVTCLTSEDCLGGWFCAGEKVCRDPLKPGPFACSADAECGGGWRCTTQGVCADAAADLAAAPPPRAASLPVRCSPWLPGPFTDVRVASPAQAFDAMSGEGAQEVTMTLRSPGGLTAVTVGSVLSLQESSVKHQVHLAPLAFDAGAAIDFLSVGPVALQVLPGDRVQVSLQGSTPRDLDVAPNSVLRLGSFTRQPTDALGLPLPMVVTDGPAFVVLPDAGTVAVGSRVLDIAAYHPASGGPPLLFASVNKTATAFVVQQADLTEPLDGVTPLWSQPIVTGDLYLSELRTHDDAVAGAWRTSPLQLGLPTLLPAAEFAEVLLGPAVARGSMRGTCGPGERLEDFELVTGDGGELTLEIACRLAGAASAIVYATTPTRSQRPVLERQALGAHGAWRAHARVTGPAAVSFGASLREFDLSPFLSRRPEVLGRLGAALFAVAQSQVYFEADAGLVLESGDTDPLAAPVGLVRDGLEVVLGYGIAFSVSRDAGPSPSFVLQGTPRLQRAEGRRFGRAIIVAGDDTLYAGTEGDAGVPVLSSVLRPAPGFPVDSWAVRPLDGGFEGWLVSNNQLFALEANRVDRWRATPWPVRDRDVVSVWWAGAGARVGTTSGEVIALPSRVPVASPVPGGVESIAGRCGDAFAVAGDELLQLEADGGWGIVGAATLRGLQAPRLQEGGAAGFFLVDDDGVVLELAVPASCP